VHYEYPAYKDAPTVIGWVMNGSPAQQSGLQPGDKITRIEDINNPTWEQTLIRSILNANQPVQIDVQRGDQTLHTTVVPKPTGRDQLGEVLSVPEI
jgi:regulator of sigma E protease